MKHLRSRIRIGCAAIAVAMLAAEAASLPSALADPTMEEKRQAEITAGQGSGRPIEARPGKTIKGSELPADLAKLPGIKPDDELKMVKDDLMGEEFAVNLTLAKDWKAVIGGSAPEWTGKIAPTVKPGTVITPANYKTFPDLDKLLPPQLYARLAPGAWDGIKEIKVGETDQYFPPRGYIDATKASKYSVKGYSVENWKGGMPFAKPTSADQILTNYLYRYWADDLYFKFDWYLIGAQDTLNRTISGQMFAMRYNGRVLGANNQYDAANESVLEKISTLIEGPKDVRGIALSRVRDIDIAQTDSIQIYLPALRRVRRLSGRDTQDPLVGTDLTWDDYVGLYQQISPENSETKLVGEGEILVPSAYTKPVQDTSRGQFLHNASDFDMKDMSVSFKKWQRRPVWVIDLISKDPSYYYSKRRLWIDKEVPNIIHVETYDRRGNHWKTLRNAMSCSSANGDCATWDWGDFADDVNKHRTAWIFKWESLKGLSNENFDTAMLTKMTQ